MITGALSCSDDVLAAVERHTRAHLDGEVGGFLLGVIADGTVDVRVAMPAEDAVGGRAQVTFTHADWDAAHRAVDTGHPDLQIVGWYHSHPGFGIFLSEYDTFIHANFFAEPEMVALVRDPHDGAVGWFGWRDGEIALLRGSEGVDGRSPVDSGAAPAPLATGAHTDPRRTRGVAVFGGVALLIAGFAVGWGAGPLERDDAQQAGPAVAGEVDQLRQALSSAEDRAAVLAEDNAALRAELEERDQDPEPDAADELAYTVRPGDTLSSLAQAFYGATDASRILARANDIADPDVLEVGRRLTIPAAP